MTTNNFRDALDRLENGDKWCKVHIYNDSDGSRCLLGALGNAHEESQEMYDIVSEQDNENLAKVIREQFPERFDSRKAQGVITDFNDDRRTTFDDVRLVLEKAAIAQDEIVI